jgi:hypothetical protein
VAERLREYNYEVVDKDLSGTWAMQAQMRGSFAPPEPSDEEIKDAIWVVIDTPPQSMDRMGPPPTPLGPKLTEHLKAGGSALILPILTSRDSRPDDLADALGEWGIKLRSDVLAVHERVETGGSEPSDLVERAQFEPLVFIFKEYGDHLLTKPLRSLDGALVPLFVVQTEPKPGYTVTPIIPVPQTLKTWGETNFASVLGEDSKPEYNAPKAGESGGDLPPPLFGGAISEKVGGGRLVVLGSGHAAMENLVNYPDMQLAKLQIHTSRFPANAELFLNSIFWLSKKEPMIAVSPMAMEVSRIGEMDRVVLNAWRIGLLLVILPGAVVLAGVMVYVRRRD